MGVYTNPPALDQQVLFWHSSAFQTGNINNNNNNNNNSNNNDNANDDDVDNDNDDAVDDDDGDDNGHVVQVDVLPKRESKPLQCLF